MSEYKVIKNEKCVICDEYAPNGHLCKKCWLKQKNFIDFSDFLDDTEIKNSYFSLKKTILSKNNSNKIIENLYTLASLAILLKDDSFDDYLYDRLPKDFDYIRYEKIVKQNQNRTTQNKSQTKINNKEIDAYIKFCEKYPKEFMCDDRHLVRSRAEVIIDNFLYNHKISHAPEVRIDVDKNNNKYIYSDFYLNNDDVHIEFWGLKTSEYEKSKAFKKTIYQELNLKLVELDDNDIKNPECILDKISQVKTPSKKQNYHPYKKRHSYNKCPF